MTTTIHYYGKNAEDTKRLETMVALFTDRYSFDGDSLSLTAHADLNHLKTGVVLTTDYNPFAPSGPLTGIKLKEGSKPGFLGEAYPESVMVVLPSGEGNANYTYVIKYTPPKDTESLPPTNYVKLRAHNPQTTPPYRSLALLIRADSQEVLFRLSTDSSDYHLTLQKAR